MKKITTTEDLREEVQKIIEYNQWKIETASSDDFDNEVVETYEMEIEQAKEFLNNLDEYTR